MPAVFLFSNFMLLTIAPHVVYYQASSLSDEGSLGYQSVRNGFICSIGTGAVKLLLLATLVFMEDVVPIPFLGEAIQVGVGMLDVVGLWVALAAMTHRSLASHHKATAVGLGWSLADLASRRLLPMWVAAMREEYQPQQMAGAVSTNFAMFHFMAVASTATLLWAKRAKAPALLPLLKLALPLQLAMLPIVRLFEEQVVGPLGSVVLHALMALVSCLMARVLNGMAQGKTS